MSSIFSGVFFFFEKKTLFKKQIADIIWVLNNLDFRWGPALMGPHLVPTCLQILPTVFKFHS